MPQLGLKTVRELAERPCKSYLIVGVWLLAVQKRRQPVADQGLDSGRHHATWNPILADIPGIVWDTVCNCELHFVSKPLDY